MVSGLSAAELSASGSTASPGAGAGEGAGGAADGGAGNTDEGATAEGATTGAGAAAGPGTVVAEGLNPSATLRPVLRGIGLFVIGFTVVFVGLGATASGIGSLLHGHRYVLSQVSGALIVALGAVMVLGALPSSVWANAGSGTLGVVSRVTGEHRFDVRPSRLGSWAAPVMGMAFAFAWTPCIGPVLGAVLGLASRNGTLAGGAFLLLAYSLGLAVPFVLVGLAFGRFTALLARTRRWLWAVELTAGVILVVFGVLLLTDNVGWVSNHISDLLNNIGLGRLSKS
jgi:cytochrome c-type biogenesis protein